MSPINAFIAAFFTVFAIVLFVISWITYKRMESPRLLFVTLAFLVFIIKGVLVSIYIFWENDLYFSLSIIVDMIILLLLSFSVLRKRG